MADVTLLLSAMAGLKHAADIAVGLHKLHTLTEVNTKAVELLQVILNVQGAALSAQAEQSTMIEEIRKLKEELVRVKAWEAQKQRYALTPPMDFGGAVVYALKESMSAGEPPHWICAQCYEEGRRSILNPQYPKGQPAMLHCGVCRNAVHYRFSGQIPDAQYASE